PGLMEETVEPATVGAEPPVADLGPEPHSVPEAVPASAAQLAAVESVSEIPSWSEDTTAHDSLAFDDDNAADNAADDDAPDAGFAPAQAVTDGSGAAEDDDLDDDGPAWFSELTGEEPAVAAPSGGGEIYLDDLFGDDHQPVLDLAERPRWVDEVNDDDTRAVPRIAEDEGGRFLAELRDVDDEGLEPADDDTDAAMTAFFDQDAPAGDEGTGRWRMFRR
ncbi:MAG: hypothetical protein KDB21_02070, partial [Acidimicrobiales bacterium]|nr:hypothetical protein [Acidimicrobiales bacterium]